MGENFGKVDVSMSNTQRQSMAISVQLTKPAYHCVCKRSGLCIDWPKSLAVAKVCMVGPVVRPTFSTITKTWVFLAATALKWANSVCWRKSPPHNCLTWLVKLILLLLWIILLSDGANLSWWCHIWYGGTFWKLLFFYVTNLKKIDGYNFTTHKTCIPWCMQKLRSVHIPNKKLEWRQGLHGWTRGTSHVLKNHETIRFPCR